MRRAPTGRLLPKTSWTRRLALLTLLLVALETGCCGQETAQPPPVVVQRELPPLLPDRRDAVLARFDEIAYVGSSVTMPADLWRLVSECTAAGWANAAALRRAGWGEAPGRR